VCRAIHLTLAILLVLGLADGFGDNDGMHGGIGMCQCDVIKSEEYHSERWKGCVA